MKDEFAVFHTKMDKVKLELEKNKADLAKMLADYKPGSFVTLPPKSTEVEKPML